jgi:CheY-like chemotaxis protein
MSIEAGIMELMSLEFNLQELVDNVVFEVGDLTGQDGVDLIVELDGNIPTALNGDSEKLTKVMSNLLENAKKYTKNGEINILVRLLERKDNVVKLYFLVKDTGVGLAKNVQQHINNCFIEIENNFNEGQCDGSGTNLCAAEQMVKVMGGHIEFETEENVGSTFHFILPFEKALTDFELLTGQDGSSTLADSDGEKESYKGRILVVDDNHVNQMVIKGMMDFLGYDTMVVDNGVAALAVYEKFDIILMDLDMPVMDGFEATQKIREAENKTQVPIIALTAHDFDGVKEECMAIGMNDYLTKPIQIEELKETMGHWDSLLNN